MQVCQCLWQICIIAGTVTIDTAIPTNVRFEVGLTIVGYASMCS